MKLKTVIGIQYCFYTAEVMPRLWFPAAGRLRNSGQWSCLSGDALTFLQDFLQGSTHCFAENIWNKEKSLNYSVSQSAHRSAQNYGWTFIMGTIISYREIQVLFTLQAKKPAHYKVECNYIVCFSWREAVITFQTSWICKPR